MKALSVLALLLSEPTRIYPWPPAEVVKELGLPPSTVYRNLAQLRKAGLVSRRPGGYVLGRRIITAGIEYYDALRKFGVNNITQLEEKIYGK